MPTSSKVTPMLRKTSCSPRTKRMDSASSEFSSGMPRVARNSARNAVSFSASVRPMTPAPTAALNSSLLSIERFYDQVAVRIDTNIGGDGHGFARDRFRIHVGFIERAGGGERVIATRTDAHHVHLRLQ